MNACIVYEHVYMWISQMHGLYDHGIDCTKLCMAGSPLAPRDKYAHLPFGVGPHMCIGYRFALAEAVTTLVHVYKVGFLWECLTRCIEIFVFVHTHRSSSSSLLHTLAIVFTSEIYIPTITAHGLTLHQYHESHYDPRAPCLGASS